MEIQRFQFSVEQNDQWNGYVAGVIGYLKANGVLDGNGYIFTKPGEMPATPFDGLIAKDARPLMVISGSQTGVFVSIEVHRVDLGPKAVDQNPCGIFVLPSGNGTQATVVHHGNWQGRTIVGLTEQELNYVQQSGITDRFPLLTAPPSQWGPLDALARVHRLAFEQSTDPLH